MAFSWYKGKTPIQKELIAKATQAYKLGDALGYNADGEVAPVGATVKPEFICASADFTAKEGDKVVGQVIEEDMEFVTTFSAAPTSIKLGNKVTLANASQVTNTTANGVAEVIAINGDGVGAEAIVKF